jgi:small subunit ribosomal protein S16
VAVKIRLMRVGKRKQPTYRVVVADARSPRDGRIIETIGNYGPRQEPSQIAIDGDRALAWLRKGAKPTESVQKLLTITGVWATFTADHPAPVTKLNRRGFATGRSVSAQHGARRPTVPGPPPAVAATPAPPAATPAPPAATPPPGVAATPAPPTAPPEPSGGAGVEAATGPVAEAETPEDVADAGPDAAKESP